MKRIAFYPGLICPDCGEVYQEPLCKKKISFTDEHYEETPHSDQKDCIRFLQKELKQCREDIYYLLSKERQRDENS